MTKMELPIYYYNRRKLTVDYRLKEFRTINSSNNLIWIGFSEPLGDKILAKMIKDGKADLSKINL
jgi:hypothetical protein